MCGGPSSTELKLQDEEANFYATQIDAYHTAYGNFKSLQDRLDAQFAPIIAKGPNQFGFSDAELQNLNSIATEGTARNYGSAKRALQESIATQGGGTSNVNQTSGESNQLQEQLASDAAGVESGQQQQIQEAGYALGHQEWGTLLPARRTWRPAGIPMPSRALRPRAEKWLPILQLRSPRREILCGGRSSARWAGSPARRPDLG
jgi:hypothetical protein